MRKSHRLVLAFWWSALCSLSRAWGAPLEIVSPQPNQSVEGDLPLQVRIDKVPRVASLEYVINGRQTVGPLTAAPYDAVWHAALVWNGPCTVQAVARNEKGEVIASSDIVPFTVAHAGGTIHLVSPDIGAPWRGTVHWEMEANRTFTDEEVAAQKKQGIYPKPVEALLFFVDGKLEYLGFGAARRAIDLDTTQYANGPHELFVAAYGFMPGVPPLGMWQRAVNFDNGHARRDVRPRWRDLFLAPGQTIALAPRVVYTDGAQEPATTGVTYETDNASVATVDAGGTVRAVAAGVANIALQSTVAMPAGDAAAAARAVKNTTRVVVDGAHGFAHFAKDGAILQQYDPARSMFVRTLFNLGTDQVANTPGLSEAAHAAGINALTTGFYHNPADGGHQPDFATWSKGWTPWWDRLEKITRDNDFSLVLTGDDIARTQGEMHESVTNPWVVDAIRHAMTKARDSKRVAAIEMVDETSMMWGGTPVPTDGRWMKRNPPLGDDAFTRLMGIINGVPGRPPLTWPVIGLSGPEDAHNWMGDPRFSDYATQFWDVVEWRRAYPWGASFPQFMAAMDRAVRGRYPVLQRDRPFMMLMSVCGPYYQKQGEGTEFVPGQDKLLGAGITPEAVAAETMYAAANGMAGVRAYAFDADFWKQPRRDAKVGQGDLQTGSEPFATGTDRWQAISAAFNLIGTLEPVLLQPQVSAPDLGPTIVTGARKGPRGALLIAVNFSEMGAIAEVDLSPYAGSGVRQAIRYRLRGGNLETGATPAGKESVAFHPGETIVWYFPAAATSEPPNVIMAWPPANAVILGKVNVRAAATGRDLKRMEFAVDGKTVCTVAASPYQFPLDTAGLAPGKWHGITATAYDAAGHQAQARVAVQVAAKTP